MQLSKRLFAISQMVTAGNRLVDVGTDHGYIPIYLVQNKQIPSAIAMDINKGPIKKAEEHINEYGLSNLIETRLSDGLAKYSKGEGDTILIAGMGGPLTIRILTDGLDKLVGIKELVLSPQSEIHLVRQFLLQSGYIIIDEQMVIDEGKYYTIMKAVLGVEEHVYASHELEYGYIMIKKKDKILFEFIQKEKKKYNNIITELLKNKSEAGVRRIEELKIKIADMDKVIEEY